jgi:hypothetical protein
MQDLVQRSQHFRVPSELEEKRFLSVFVSARLRIGSNKSIIYNYFILV